MPRLPIGGYFASPHDRARLLDVVDLRDLDAHDPLIEDRRDQMREGLVDPHDRRDVGGLEPAGEIGDRLEVEGAVLVVDRAVVEAGGLDDPRHAARRELLEPGPERGPPLAHRPPYAVLFHGSLQVGRLGSSIDRAHRGVTWMAAKRSASTEVQAGSSETEPTRSSRYLSLNSRRLSRANDAAMRPALLSQASVSARNCVPS